VSEELLYPSQFRLRAGCHRLWASELIIRLYPYQLLLSSSFLIKQQSLGIVDILCASENLHPTQLLL
jgi:hypothetical protein